MVDTSTEAVTKLLDGVTPGPWGVDPLYATIVSGSKSITEVFTSDADARFIAAARDLVPALLAERDALKKERDDAMEGWHVIHPNITVQDAARVVADGLADVARRLEMHECAMAERDDCIEDWSKANDRIKALLAERDDLRTKLDAAVEALEKLARLGNGNMYGNSDGNMIARATLRAIAEGKE